MSTMLHSLYNLLRNDTPWNWTKDCQQAFDKARMAVSQAPVLAHYDVTKPIKLYSVLGVKRCFCNALRNIITFAVTP